MRDTFLTSLVHAHQPQLLRFLSNRIGNRADAEDLVQEVYVRLMSVERPDLIRSPRAYLFRVATNLAYERWVKHSALPIFTELDDLVADASPETDAEMTERVEQLARILQQLPPKVRASLIWAHRDGHSYAEIGARLGVPKNRVKKYLVKGLACCRKYAAAAEIGGMRRAAVGLR